MTDVRLVRANGIQLAYRESGPAPAPPLLLLHALGENSADWDEVAAALAAYWHVYALDLRGHGRSDWPGTYTLALLRDDVLAFLDALKLPEAGGPDSHVSQDRLADMAALIPGGQLITIPAGHLVHAAQPARFISAVTAFLAGAGAPPDPPA